MICDDCKEAGRVPAASLRQTERQAAGIMSFQVFMWHEKCKGGTQCDCQHVLGKAIAEGEPK